MAKPCELLQLDISRPGSEVEAIKSAQLSTLIADGWTLGPWWLTVRENAETGQPEGMVLQIAMMPPSSAYELQAETLQGLSGLVRGSAAHAAASQQQSELLAGLTREVRLWALLIALLQVALLAVLWGAS